MSIQERINPENLNIHQFQEAPKSNRWELHFDPERDISPEMKQKILDYFKNQPLSHVTIQGLCRVKLLWPEENLDFFSDQEYLDLLANSPVTTDERLTSIYGIKCIRPDIKIPITSNQILVFRKLIEEDAPVRGIKYWHMVAYNIIDPEHEYTLTLGDINDAKAQIDKYKVTSVWFGVAQYAAGLRLLDSGYHLQLDSKDWSSLRKDLESWRNELNGCTEYAFYLKIVAAHSVKITAPGVIDIQMYPPEDLNQSIPPIPETRKF